MNETSQEENNVSRTEEVKEDSRATLLASPQNGTIVHPSSDLEQSHHIGHDIASTPLTNVGPSVRTAPETEKTSEEAGIKVYKRRWVVLSIFVLFTIVGTYQWSMYTIISNVITKYYGVSSLSVDFTALSYLIIYLVAFLPAGWILNNWVSFLFGYSLYL